MIIKNKLYLNIINLVSIAAFTLFSNVAMSNQTNGFIQNTSDAILDNDCNDSDAISDPTKRQYIVSLILFKHLREDASEAWPQRQPHTFKLSATTLDPKQPPTVDRCGRYDTLSAIPKEDWLLQEESMKINRSINYQLMYYANWYVELSESHPEMEILIKSGYQLGNHAELEGTVSISLGTYLHSNFTIWYNTLNPIMPIPALLMGRQFSGYSLPFDMTLPAQELQNRNGRWGLFDDLPYSRNNLLTTSKKLVLNQLTYADTPVFGALVQVSRAPMN